MGRGGVTTVTLYGRPGCHLCDQARAEILKLRGAVPPFELREVNIDEDDELHRRFLERVPVVEVDGEVVSELKIDRGREVSMLDTVRR